MNLSSSIHSLSSGQQAPPHINLKEVKESIDDLSDIS